MNKFLKYIIYFILGIISYYLLFNKDLIEGLCVDYIDPEVDRELAMPTGQYLACVDETPCDDRNKPNVECLKSGPHDKQCCKEAEPICVDKIWSDWVGEFAIFKGFCEQRPRLTNLWPHGDAPCGIYNANECGTAGVQAGTCCKLEWVDVESDSTDPPSGSERPPGRSHPRHTANVISMRSCSAPANAERYIINGEPPPSDINYDDFASTINVSCKQGWEGSATITKCEHPDTYHSRYTLSGCEPQVPIEPEVTIETAPSNDMNLVYLATGTKDNRGCQNYTCKNSENTYDNWLIKIPPCARNLSDSNASCDPEYYTCNNIDTDKTIHSNDDLIKCNNSLCCDNYVCHAHVNESQCEGEKKLLPNKQCRVKTLNAENDCNTDACCNDWSSDTNITELSQLFDEIINFRDLRKTNLGDSKINGEDIRNFLYYKLLDLKAMKDNSEPTLKWILMNKYLEE